MAHVRVCVWRLARLTHDNDWHRRSQTLSSVLDCEVVDHIVCDAILLSGDGIVRLALVCVVIFMAYDSKSVFVSVDATVGKP